MNIEFILNMRFRRAPQAGQRPGELTSFFIGNGLGEGRSSSREVP